MQAMIYYPITDIWFYLLAAGVLAAIGGYAWQYRQTVAAVYWSLALFIRSAWMLALVMITISPTLDEKLFWVRIQQSCALSLLPVILLFVTALAEKRGRIIRLFIGGLVLLSALSILEVQTGWSKLYWDGVLWDGTTVGIVRGPFYWVMLAIAYFEIFLDVVLCIVWGLQASGLRRWQILAVPLDPLTSVAGHVLWVISQKTGVGSIPVLPLFFLLSASTYSYIFFQLRVFNLGEQAQATVTRNMNDILIIIDEQDYIVELNPAGVKLLGKGTPGLTGMQPPEAFACWPPMVELAAGQEERSGTIFLENRHYFFRITPLSGWRGSRSGKVIVLQDITELREAQAQITEQQKALALAAERDRLRRELHDGPGQVWPYLQLEYQKLKELLAGQRLDEAVCRLEKLITLSEDRNNDIRDSLAGLKNTAGKAFIPILADFMRWYQEAYGIAARLTADPETVRLLSPSSELQLLRIIQEAMANVRKHAHAGLVQIEIGPVTGQAAVVIQDDGRGFDASAALVNKKNRHGLAIMRERAGEINGRLEIVSEPEKGTRITVWLPLKKGGLSHETAIGG